MRKRPSKRGDVRRKTKSSRRTDGASLDASQRLQSVLFAAEVATWTWDIVNDRVIADKNLARLFGVSAEDAAGGPIEKYTRAIHPDDRPAVAAAIATAVEGPNDRFESDYRIVGKGGAISWVTARGKVERDARGKPKYFPGVVIDVTERKGFQQKTEELLRRLEQQSRIFDTTLSSITDFAYIFDRAGRFVYVNQALLDLWGLKLEAAVGKNFYELKYPDDLAERLQRQIQQVFDTKTGLTDETPYTSPTGAGGYYEYIFSPVFDADGNVEVVAGSTRNITQRKQTEKELRESQESLRTLAETLESQVRERTNELEDRTEHLRQLSVRLMEIQDQEGRRIARELHDSAGQMISVLSITCSQLLREIQAKAPELTKLAEEALTYVEEIGHEIRTTSYLLHPPMLDEMGLQVALNWFVEGLTQRTGIEVTLNIDKKFERPSRAMELTIFRIVQECLTNIHRHSGSRSAHIRIARENSNTTVEVRDEGRGISADKLASLRNKSAGIGLRGMGERVRQFGGDFRVESHEGKGTTILVTLPQPSTAGVS